MSETPLLLPEIQEQICNFLSIDDAGDFLSAIQVICPNCSITFFDLTGKRVILEGITPQNIELYQLIRRYGLDHLLLHYARNGNIEEVQKYLELGADPNAKTEELTTPLLLATFWSEYELAELLIQYGSDVNAEDKLGRTSLLASVRNNNLDIFNLLITNGANINHRNRDGKTVLFQSVEDDNEKGVKLLLTQGADPNILDNDGLTALMVAHRLNRLKIIDLLLEFGLK